MPDFIIIGAVKAGTTSLYHYLGQHPSIQMSQNNWPRFFHIDNPPPNFHKLKAKYGDSLLSESLWRYRLMCHPGVPRTYSAYKKMWPLRKQGQLHGEVSPTYLYDASVPAKIQNRLPNIKLIAILRQPAARAYSHFVMDVTHGWVPENNFTLALKREPRNIDEFWWGLRHYLRHGLYSHRIEQLLTIFDSEQIKIMLYDDYQSMPGKFIQDIFSFIGVDPSFKVNMETRHNQGLIVVQNKDGGGNKRQLVKPPPLPVTASQSLTKYFRNDIKRLQDLTQRDLSAWLT